MLDFCVVGGGIVGLATAYALLRKTPGAELLLLEKEASLGRHQTGHNSGVIHSGIYYAPSSRKSLLCRAGAAATKAFCAEHGIAVEACGKMLVATDAQELSRMEDLARRATETGIDYERLDAGDLTRREPHISGLGALFLPTTGIVDYRAIALCLAREIERMGGSIVTGAHVRRIEEQPNLVAIETGSGRFEARTMVACAGLQADRLVACAGVRPDFQIIPFRGEYFKLRPEREGLINALIYPIPNPALPFLGIHLTRMVGGGITVGPNAVLGLARERYAKFALDPVDSWRMLGFPGFWKMLSRNLRPGLAELKNSLWPRGYLAACRKYCPSLTLADLIPMEAGIRAQAVLRDGTLVNDFLFHRTARSVHVCNAPSPAATSALPIGEVIAGEMISKEGLLF